MLTIDGSEGEGGGQILRTALALSLITGTPFRMEKIRARRKRPGIMRQHLTAIRAAATVGDAEVEGDAISSRELRFAPRTLVAGDHHFAIGSAGSATLVLQTILPALLGAKSPSSLSFEGGTHNPLAPTFTFLEKAFLPLINKMGPTVDAKLHRHGFYPAGGGKISVAIRPAPLSRLDLDERGTIRACRATAMVAALPYAIARREAQAVAGILGWPAEQCRAITVEDSDGPGNVVEIEIESDALTEVFSAFGEKGRPAESVAEQAAHEARAWLESGAPVGEHLADQLLLPLALAGAGSFRTVAPTPHTLTQIEVIARFLGRRFVVQPIADRTFRVAVA
jgi:RNA 3'-terminal phosphate cyclase (ATP)